MGLARVVTGVGGASLKRLQARHRGAGVVRWLRLLVRGVAVGSGCGEWLRWLLLLPPPLLLPSLHGERYFGSTTIGKGVKPSVFELSTAEAELSGGSSPGDLKSGDQNLRPSLKRTCASYVSCQTCVSTTSPLSYRSQSLRHAMTYCPVSGSNASPRRVRLEASGPSVVVSAAVSTAVGGSSSSSVIRSMTMAPASVAEPPANRRVARCRVRR